MRQPTWSKCNIGITLTKGLLCDLAQRTRRLRRTPLYAATRSGGRECPHTPGTTCQLTHERGANSSAGARPRRMVALYGCRNIPASLVAVGGTMPPTTRRTACMSSGTLPTPPPRERPPLSRLAPSHVRPPVLGWKFPESRAPSCAGRCGTLYLSAMPRCPMTYARPVPARAAPSASDAWQSAAWRAIGHGPHNDRRHAPAPKAARQPPNRRHACSPPRTRHF